MKPAIQTICDIDESSVFFPYYGLRDELRIPKIDPGAIV